MKIFIGADHRGFELKQYLKDNLEKNNYSVEDKGNLVLDPQDDYPDFAYKVAEEVQKGKGLGIIICGSGVGVSIVANRLKGVRAALGFNKDQVKKARQHDHCNVLCLPADYIEKELALELVKTFLNTTPLQREKYLRRIKKIDRSNF